MSDATCLPGLRRDAELVVAVCMSVEPDDVVTIITDDDHLDEANALAQVVVERGGYPGDRQQRASGAAGDRRHDASRWPRRATCTRR